MATHPGNILGADTAEISYVAAAIRFGIGVDELTIQPSSKRLQFRGDSRNTTISLKKIVDGHVYSDCVKIKDSAGKPDFFSMNVPQARFISPLLAF